jgi:hypothetical protein
MPKGGFEPPLSYENCALNAARLPVPPLRHQLRPAIAERIKYIGRLFRIKRKLRPCVSLCQAVEVKVKSLIVLTSRRTQETGV